MRHFLYLILWMPVHGQSPVFPQSAAFYSAGIPGHAFLENPAALAFAEGRSLWIAAGKTFMLTPAFSMAARLPVGASSFGIRAGYSGDAILQEMQGGLAYGRKLADIMSVGILFNYFSQQVPAHAAEQIALVEGGMMLQVSPQLLTGMRVSKPVFSQREDEPGTGFHAGLGYTVSDRFVLAASVNKMPSRAAGFQLAGDYSFEERVSVSLGYLSGTTSWFFGTALGFTGFKLEMMANVHPDLGISPSLSLLFQKKKKKNELVR